MTETTSIPFKLPSGLTIPPALRDLNASELPLPAFVTDEFLDACFIKERYNELIRYAHVIEQFIGARPVDNPFFDREGARSFWRRVLIRPLGPIVIATIGALQRHAFTLSALSPEENTSPYKYSHFEFNQLRARYFETMIGITDPKAFAADFPKEVSESDLEIIQTALNAIAKLVPLASLRHYMGRLIGTIPTAAYPNLTSATLNLNEVLSPENVRKILGANLAPAAQLIRANSHTLLTETGVRPSHQRDDAITVYRALEKPLFARWLFDRLPADREDSALGWLRQPTIKYLGFEDSDPGDNDIFDLLTDLADMGFLDESSNGKDLSPSIEESLAALIAISLRGPRQVQILQALKKEFENGFEHIIAITPLEVTDLIRSASIGDWPAALEISADLRPPADQIVYGHPIAVIDYSKPAFAANLPPQIIQGQNPILPFPDDFLSDDEIISIFDTEKVGAALNAAPMIFEAICGLQPHRADADRSTRCAFWRAAIARPSFYPAIAVVTALTSAPASNSWRHGLTAQKIFDFPDHLKPLFQYLFSGYTKPTIPYTDPAQSSAPSPVLDGPHATIAASWNPLAEAIIPLHLPTLLLYCLGAFNYQMIAILRQPIAKAPDFLTPAVLSSACAYTRRDWPTLNAMQADLSRSTGIPSYIITSTHSFIKMFIESLARPMFIHGFQAASTRYKLCDPIDTDALAYFEEHDKVQDANITANAVEKFLGRKIPSLPEMIGNVSEQANAVFFLLIAIHCPEIIRFKSDPPIASRYLAEFIDFIEYQICYEIPELFCLCSHNWKSYFSAEVDNAELDRISLNLRDYITEQSQAIPPLPSIMPVDDPPTPLPPTLHPAPRHLLSLRRKSYHVPDDFFYKDLIEDFDAKLAPMLPRLRENADIFTLLTGLEPPSDDIGDRLSFWRAAMRKPLFYAAFLAATAIRDNAFTCEGELRLNAVLLRRGTHFAYLSHENVPPAISADLVYLWRAYTPIGSDLEYDISQYVTDDIVDSVTVIKDKLAVSYTAHAYSLLALKLTGRLEQALWDKLHESYLTPPEEITPSLIATHLPTDKKKLIRKLHRHRVRLTRASKLAWPVNPPSTSEFAEILLKALKTPLLLQELNDICQEEFAETLEQAAFPDIRNYIFSNGPKNTYRGLAGALVDALVSPDEKMRAAAILTACIMKAGIAQMPAEILKPALAHSRTLFDYLTASIPIKTSILRQLTIGNWQKYFSKAIVDHNPDEQIETPKYDKPATETQAMMTFHPISTEASTNPIGSNAISSSYEEALRNLATHIEALSAAITAYRASGNHKDLIEPLNCAREHMLDVIAFEPHQALLAILQDAGLDPVIAANRLKKAAMTAKIVHAALPDHVASDFWTIIATLADKSQTKIAPVHQSAIVSHASQILHATETAETTTQTLSALFQAAFGEGDIDTAMRVHLNPETEIAFAAICDAIDAGQKIHAIAALSDQCIVDFLPIITADQPALAPPAAVAQPDPEGHFITFDLTPEDTHQDDAGDEPPPAIENEPEPAPPVTTIERRANAVISKLIERHAFGVARLVAASLAEAGESPLMPAELFELAASAPAHCPATNQNRAYDLTMALEPAIASLESRDNEIRTATGLLLIGALIGPAVLDANAVAATLLKPLSIDPALDATAFKLRTVIEKLTNYGTTLTPGTIAALNDSASLRDSAVEAAKHAASDARRLRTFDYNFTPHADIISAICARDGYISTFAAAMETADAPADEAAANFLATFADADKIERWLNQMAHTHCLRPQMIRQPLLGLWINRINQIAGNCLVFVEIRKAIANVKRVGHRAAPIRAASEAAIKIMTSALAEIEAFIPASPLVVAAARFASERLRALLVFLSTATSTPGSQTQIEAALHFDLLLSPGLTFLRDATPQQKGAELLDSIETALANLSYNGDPGERILAIARNGAAIPALRAAYYLPVFGVNLKRQSQITADLKTIIERKRAELASDHASTTRQLEQSERIANSEGATRLIERLSERLARIRPALIPAEVEAISQIPEEAAFYDFPEALREIDDIREQINQINEEPRQRLLTRLSTIDNPNPGPAERIRSLIAANDFVTAEDYLAMLESGETLPRVAAANLNFRAFYPGFIESMDALPSPTTAVQTALNDGEAIDDVVPEDLTRAERTHALEVLGQWRALENSVAPQAHAITSFFAALGLPARVVSSQKDGHIVDFDLPSDRGFLLPNFGSLAKTHGWKIQVAKKLPQEAILKDFGKCPAAVCIVTETLDRAARRRLAEFTRLNRLPLLVIDESAMLYAALQRHAAPTTILEIVQPFAYADPFNDNGGGAVPREIFVGRESEIAMLIDPNGAALLYGGRRLGKTATLRQAQQNVAEMVARGAANIEMIYLDIRNISVTDDDGRIFTEIAAQLPAIFGKTTIRRPSNFRDKIIAWLANNPGARIICALDEVDNFVAHDSANDFPQIQMLKALMDETSRRFKIILAGNRDVTRFVRTGNTPLRHLSSNILRIGPFVGASERADAEKLITKPLAALGYEFERRELAWTLLSHGLYYPILAQVLSKRLLAWMRSKPSNYDLPITITQADVQAVIADPKTSAEVADKFQSTLTLDPRYGYLANIVALLENPANPDATSTHQIAENAATFWPVAFPPDKALWIVQDILDEMDGLGVVKQSSARVYILRSNAIRELLGSRSVIEATIMQFSRTAAPTPLTPSDLHRELKPDPRIPETTARPYSPFTIAQEREIANCKEPVLIITGSAATHIELASIAILQNPQLAHSERIILAPQKKEGLTAQIANYANQAKRAIIVVSTNAAWDANWVRDALAFATVKNNQTRVFFIAGDSHAAKIASSSLVRSDPDIRTITTAPWTQAMIAEAFTKHGIAAHLGLDEAILNATGGYPLHAINAMTLITGAANARETLKAWRLEKETQPSFFASLGWTPDITSMLNTFREWTLDGGEYRYKDLPAMFDGANPVTQIDPFLYQAEAMSLILRSEDQQGPKWRLNPIFLPHKTD